MVKTPVATKAKRKRNAKHTPVATKRHSPDDNHINSSTPDHPHSSSTYDKVARATLDIRKQIFRRQRVHLDTDTTDTDTSPDNTPVSKSYNTPASKKSNTPLPKVPTTASVIDLCSSSESVRTSVSHSASFTPDAGIATPLPHARPIRFRHTNDTTTPIAPPRHGSLHSGDSKTDVSAPAPAPVIPCTWPLKRLEEATGNIAGVQQLIAHFMFVATQNSTPTSREQTFDEHTRLVLHHQCHAMLKALQKSLDLLFNNFEYHSDAHTNADVDVDVDADSDA